MSNDIKQKIQDQIKNDLCKKNELLKELLQCPKRVFITNFQGNIITKKIKMTVKEKASTLKDLAAVRAQRIALERQAHNLDDASNGQENIVGLDIEFIKIKNG